MAIDIRSEQLLSINGATKSLHGRPHISTVWRWIQRGVRGVKLETVLIGGRRYTSNEALERFVSRTTAAAAGEPAPTRTPTQRQRAILAAERELAAAGI